MITLRKGQDRGRSLTHWLNSLHTFSFADYFDPKFMGYGDLRVINEDTVQPGYGFGTHAHQDMEIISYVVSGSLKHQDSMQHGGVIQPGEIQMMSAGTGIQHSEFNPSDSKLLHFLQIWIIPDTRDLTPSYQQKTLKRTDNQWILLGSNKPTNDALKIHQDVKLYVAYLNKDHALDYPLADHRMAWLQLIKGTTDINNQNLVAGDGAAIKDGNINIHARQDAEFLLFDLRP